MSHCRDPVCLAHAGKAQMLAREGDVAVARAALAAAKGRPGLSGEKLVWQADMRSPFGTLT